MSQNYHQRPRDNMRTVCSATMSDGLLLAISGAFPTLTAVYNRLFPPTFTHLSPLASLLHLTQLPVFVFSFPSALALTLSPGPQTGF